MPRARGDRTDSMSAPRLVQPARPSADHAWRPSPNPFRFVARAVGGFRRRSPGITGIYRHQGVRRRPKKPPRQSNSRIRAVRQPAAPVPYLTECRRSHRGLREPGVTTVAGSTTRTVATPPRMAMPLCRRPRYGVWRRQFDRKPRVPCEGRPGRLLQAAFLRGAGSGEGRGGHGCKALFGKLKFGRISGLQRARNCGENSAQHIARHEGGLRMCREAAATRGGVPMTVWDRFMAHGRFSDVDKRAPVW